MIILAIETSCDETAAAVVKDGTEIISNVVASSSAMHEKWGGIVPEVAAREQLKSIVPVIMEALSVFVPEPSVKSDQKGLALSSRLSLDSNNGGGTIHLKPAKSPELNRNFTAYKPIIEKNIDAIAVTVGPGLIGSLLVGVEAAKTISFITGKPLIPVNHVLAHMYANFIAISDEEILNPKSQIPNNKIIQQYNNQIIKFPAISLVVSGGHTELFLMTSPKELKWLGGTIDDAAGEAFDKAARLLGFGSRGGLAIQEAASNFQPPISNLQIKLPRPLLNDKTLNFSFSGLKTAVLREWNKLSKDPGPKTEDLTNTFAYEVQEAITDVLVAKTMRAAEQCQAKSILISGGVAANLRLREKFISNLQLQTSNIKFFSPPVTLCTDNAAYIASYAFFRGQPVDWRKIDAQPDLSVEV